jgi:heme/copper-type cytochrome/quinol oxidase subunit 2
MAWYWWVLIAVGVIALGVLKLKVWNSIMQKRKDKKQRMEQEE